MKSRLKIGTLLVVLTALLTTACVGAPVKSYKDIPSPEGNARRITALMSTRLGLTEKQGKKVYKIQLAEQKTIFKYRPVGPQRGAGKDFGERPPRDHHKEGVRPPIGGGFEGMGGGRPPMHPRNAGWDNDRPNPEKVAKELAKAAQKRDKKLKKVLDKRQYSQWEILKGEIMKPFLFNPDPGKPGPRK